MTFDQSLESMSAFLWKGPYEPCVSVFLHNPALQQYWSCLFSKPWWGACRLGVIHRVQISTSSRDFKAKTARIFTQTSPCVHAFACLHGPTQWSINRLDVLCLVFGNLKKIRGICVINSYPKYLWTSFTWKRTKKNKQTGGLQLEWFVFFLKC